MGNWALNFIYMRKKCYLKDAMHCNPNGLENFDHLSTNDSGNDDRSKCTIDVIFSFYMNLE